MFLERATKALLYVVFSLTLFGRYMVGVGALAGLAIFFGIPPQDLTDMTLRIARSLLFSYLTILLWVANGFYPGGLVEAQLKHIKKKGLWGFGK